jgi:hypothetical protein
MWNKLENKLPEVDGSYPGWMVAEHSSREFWYPVTYHNGQFVIEGTLRLPKDMGWRLIAWFDLPVYRA